MNVKKLKTPMILSVIFLLFATSLPLLATTTQAQTTYTNMQEGASVPGPLSDGVTADVSVDTRAFLSFTPNPIGVNQELLINMWLNPPLHVSRYFKDYTLTITSPEGKETVIKMDSYRADATAWLNYKFDKAGNWTLKFDFPGGYFAPGNYTTAPGAALYTSGTVTSFETSVYYKPSSSPVMNLTVQQDPVGGWSNSPLPTDYWTRPINPENRDWWPIAGAYPGTGYVGGGEKWEELYAGNNPHWSDRYCFTPWVTAPNTPHVVWTRLDTLDGLIGGPSGSSSLLSAPTLPSVIYAGRCYATQTVLVNNVPTSCSVCYDLRTGEIYYARSSGGYTPTIVSYSGVYNTLSGLAAVPGASAGVTVQGELLYFSGTTMRKVDPNTGSSTSYTIGASSTYYMNQYAMYVQNLGNTVPIDQRYRLINWTTAGTNTTFASRIVTNTSYARSNFPSVIDYNAGVGVDITDVTIDPSLYATKMNVSAYDIWTGVSLWNKTVDEGRYVDSTTIADHGKVAILTQQGHFLAFDLKTGAKAWTSEDMDYPWGSAGFGSYTIQSGYGLIFREGYDGVYAYNWTDGTIAWKYKAPATPFESPYIDENGEPVYGFSWNGNGNSGTQIADGKLYTFNCEHSPTLPLTRGWRMHCINVTTGEGIWNITGYWSAGGMEDGYLTAGNSYDGKMYVFGKGQTETTLSVPSTQINTGQKFTITGTVLDMSPAQPNTAAVSDEYMSVWMEHLHMQKDMPADAKGVDVSIGAIDPNGNYIDIGTATSDLNGVYGLSWAPEVPGLYHVFATFKGSESYGSSTTSTYFTASEEPTVATIEPTPTPQSIADTYFIPATAGLFAAIVIVGILMMLMLRKRP
jgi:hypothetical protein